MGSHIRPEGWHNWGREETEKTVYYAEFNNSGPGSEIGKRVAWSKILNYNSASIYLPDEIFKGDIKQNDVFGKPWFGVVKDSSFTLNSASLKMKKLFPEANPVIKKKPSKVVETQVFYKSLLYRKLEAKVFQGEKTDGKKAGIVMVHSGGWQSGSLELLVPMAQELANYGFVTMPPYNKEKYH